ncbi:MAG: hypothetical protein HFJ54_03630 [Clostridia bacterium]|nr:hypothetical protein [Clostridia bacterium]
MLEILNFFPKNISNLILENLTEYQDKLEEIRVRVNNPIILKLTNTEIIIPYKISSEEIIRILQIACDNSIYAYQSQICKRIHNNKRWT